MSKFGSFALKRAFLGNSNAASRLVISVWLILSSYSVPACSRFDDVRILYPPNTFYLAQNQTELVVVLQVSPILLSRHLDIYMNGNHVHNLVPSRGIQFFPCTIGRNLELHKLVAALSHHKKNVAYDVSILRRTLSSFQETVVPEIHPSRHGSDFHDVVFIVLQDLTEFSQFLCEMNVSSLCLECDFLFSLPKEAGFCSACKWDSVHCVTDLVKDTWMAILDVSSLFITDLFFDKLQDIPFPGKVVHIGHWEMKTREGYIHFNHVKELEVFVQNGHFRGINRGNSSKKLIDTAKSEMKSMPSGCCNLMEDPTIGACSLADQVSIVITPSQGHRLEDQLRSAVGQSLLPKDVHVLQFEEHSRFDGLVSEYQVSNPHITFHLEKIAPTVPWSFRFNMAYMLETEYVSIWDNDTVPDNEWLNDSIRVSKENHHALVGKIGYRFIKLMSGKEKMILLQSALAGQVDFVQDLLTLRREYLRFYFLHHRPGMSAHAAELSYSLQQQGVAIRVMTKHVHDEIAKDEAEFLEIVNDDEILDHCQILSRGLKTAACLNCDDEHVKACCLHYSVKKELNSYVSRFQTRNSRCVADRKHHKKVIFLFDSYSDLLRISTLVKVFERNPDFCITVISVGKRDGITWYSGLFGNNSEHHFVQISDQPSIAYAFRFSRVMNSLQDAVNCQSGDIIFVPGDTLSAFALALVGYYCDALILHIAGDRSSSNLMDQTLLHLAHYHFALNEKEAEYILMQGVEHGRVLIVGNICEDSINIFGFSMVRPQNLPQSVVESEKFIFVSLSRISNYKMMFSIIRAISESNANNLHFFLHAPNGRIPQEANHLCTREYGFTCVGEMLPSERLWMISNSAFVVTDVLMITEETRCFQKPALVLSQAPATDCSFLGVSSPCNHENIFEIQSVITNMVTSESDIHHVFYSIKTNHATQTIYEFLIRKFNVSGASVIHDLKRSINSSSAALSYTLPVPLSAEHEYHTLLRNISDHLLSLWIQEEFQVILDHGCRLSAIRGELNCNSCVCMWFKSTDERLESVSSAGKSSFKFKYAQSHTRFLTDSLVLVISSIKDVFISHEDREKWMDEVSMVQKMIIICITNTTGAIQDGLDETSWIYRSIDPHVWQVDGVIYGSTFIIYKYARKSRSANKNLCWMFGQYGRLNNGIIGFLHLGYLASRFQRQMVVPNVAFVCSVNLPLTSLLVLEGLMYIQGYPVKLVSEDEFFSTCGSSPVVDVKGLEKESHRETCQMDGRHLFETRDVTEHHMKSSFFHIRFHSRLVAKAKRFILETFKGIPYAAVHFRNFEEDCIERVKDVIGHAYPGISNISSHLESISPMCNPNVSWVLHESEEYSRIHRISLFISSESWEGVLDNVADADRLVKPQRECEEVECALIDMIVCMESIIFFGNPASTFALNVGRLREQQFPFAGPNIFSTDRNVLFPLWFGYK